MERVAAGQTVEAQADAFDYPVFFDSFLHVFRAGRVKTAGRRQQRRDAQFIDPEYA